MYLLISSKVTFHQMKNLQTQNRDPDIDIDTDTDTRYTHIHTVSTYLHTGCTVN